MDNQHYQNLFLYLTKQPLPSNLTNQQIEFVQKQSLHFLTKNNFIYKKDKRKTGNLLRLVNKQELDALLYMFHNDPTAAHFATDSMFEKIRSRYYWPQM